MAKYEVEIKSGTGTLNIPNGTYSVESDTAGYDNTTIAPKQIEITNNIDTYNFTLSSHGTLTFHVTETGTKEGSAIVGAKFVRCDKEGNSYGDEIITDNSGNASFNNVPNDSSIKAPVVYYKQILSDEFHQFDPSLQMTVLNMDFETIEVANPLPSSKTFKLGEEQYNELPIEIGFLYLTKI